MSLAHHRSQADPKFARAAQSLFETLLGGAVSCLDYTWLRTKAPFSAGKAPDASNPHCDAIFMDRGSKVMVPSPHLASSCLISSDEILILPHPISP